MSRVTEHRNDPFFDITLGASRQTVCGPNLEARPVNTVILVKKVSGPFSHFPIPKATARFKGIGPASVRRELSFTTA
jgi:hypothetical protein